MEKQEHNTGESITGGVVYRGNAHPSLRGVYLFGDFVSRRVWADRKGDSLQQR